MPRPRVETRTARMARIVADVHLGGPEELHPDMRASSPQLAVPDLDHRRGRDHERDQQNTDAGADHECDRRVDGREDEGCHRRRQSSRDQDPERGAQSLAVPLPGVVAATIGSIGVTHGVLHYPRWVTETVDVPIIAPDVPVYAHPGDAGADLVAAEAVRLAPGERALVGTGVRIALPDGYVAFVVPRSGLAAKHGITIVNAPGTIDAGYRGEIKVILLNTDREHAHDIAVGDRVAQLIVMPVPRAVFIPVETLPDSVRGEGGFGSTGYQKDGILA
jgi:dUTP pyrophosphatase